MIGTTLQHLLSAKGINVSELSRKIDVSAQTLYSIIKRDNMKVDFEVLLKICSALNVNPDVFYQDYLSEKGIKEPFPSSNPEKSTGEVSDEAQEVAFAYDGAMSKDQDIVRLALGLAPLQTKEVQSYVKKAM